MRKAQPKVLVHHSLDTTQPTLRLECIAVKLFGDSHFYLYQPRVDAITPFRYSFHYVTHIKTPGNLFRKALPEELKFLSENFPNVLK
jgi:hypothetical protein